MAHCRRCWTVAPKASAPSHTLKAYHGAAQAWSTRWLLSLAEALRSLDGLWNDALREFVRARLTTLAEADVTGGNPPQK